MIVKVKIKGKTWFRVISHKTGRNLGTYPTREKAEERIRQLAKHRDKNG